VRRALGAGSVRAALPDVADSLLLVFLGGFAGAVLARWAVQAVVALGPGDMPALAQATVDVGALTFALLTTTIVAVLVSLAPAGIASRLAVVPALKSGGRGGGVDRRGARLTRLLVASEVALSIVLLVGSALMVRSLERLLQIELGFVPNRTLSLSVGLAAEKYPEAAQRRAFVRALVERLETLPGVVAAGAVFLRPLESGPIGMDSGVLPEGSSPRPAVGAGQLRLRELGGRDPPTISAPWARGSSMAVASPSTTPKTLRRSWS
jgi:hypothetical protein